MEAEARLTRRSFFTLLASLPFALKEGLQDSVSEPVTGASFSGSHDEKHYLLLGYACGQGGGKVYDGDKLMLCVTSGAYKYCETVFNIPMRLENKPRWEGDIEPWIIAPTKEA